MKQPCILSMDSATGPCSVAVYKGGQITAYREEMGKARQAAELVGMIERALADSECNYSDLTAIACSIGPGSFTGIRVALATARAIRFATKATGMGYSTLEILALAGHKQDHKRPILSVLKGGRDQCYWQAFTHEAIALAPPKLSFPDDIMREAPANCLTVGNASGLLPELEHVHVYHPRADLLAELAARNYPHSELSPLYIRPPDAKPQKALV